MKKNKHTERLPLILGWPFLIVLLFCSCSWVLAADKADNSSPGNVVATGGGQLIKSQTPIHIASDRMEVDQQRRIITFEGHVVAQQDDFTIVGNRMMVYAAASRKGEEKNKGVKKNKSGENNKGGDHNPDGRSDADSSMMKQIDRIEVIGDVKITQRDKVAVADKSIYYHGEQKIVLIGNPSVTQGQDRVEGRLITMYLATGKSVVEGGEATPVQAVLHPKSGDSSSE
ncbi:MAG: LptA/OstA family protein [Syntrophobacteraceae bacterium]